MQLKKISEQTIVITGATSGIGLTTARRAARGGAKLVLVARNEAALRKLAEELNAGGSSTGERAIYYAADVADEAALRGVAAVASEQFGGFDTWVNNAGSSIYSKIEETTTEDMHRLFDTNFWGVVYGSRVAARFLRANNNGGAIINIGSVLSDRAISFQGFYSASKHAVKGFTDAFRMELEAEKLPISVTLVKPSAINTPFPEHAKNYFDQEATLPPPVFAPDLVAEAILHCAQTPERDFTVGEGKLMASAGQLAPRLTDKLMEWGMAQKQFKSEPKNPLHTGTLYESHSDLSERGNYDGLVLEESLYQRAKLNPLVTSAILIGGAAALATLLVSRNNQRSDAINRRRQSERELMQIGHS